jgi:predicted PolB exonuclease-like 3'-5' exonuclease
MVLVPFAEGQQLIMIYQHESGDDIVVAFNCDLKSCPITTARCGSHNMILAPMSISLSTKTNDFQTFFGESKHHLLLVYYKYNTQ